MLHRVEYPKAIFRMFSIKKLFAGDIGDNRFGYFVMFVILGAGLYLWRSGSALALINGIQGAMLNG